MTPVTEPEVTVGELGRNLTKFEKAVTDALGTISGKLDDRPDWSDVRGIESNLLDRIKRLEDWQTWAVRLIVSAVVLAALGLIMAGPKL